MSYPDLSRFEFVVIDVEATGLKWWSDRVFGFAIGLPGLTEGEMYYDVREEPQALEWLRRELPRARLRVAYNAKYDMHMLREAKVPIDGPWACSMIDAALLDEHRMSYDLDSVARDCVGVGKMGEVWAELARLFGGAPTKNAQVGNLSRAPSRLVGQYAMQDARATKMLHIYQRAELVKQELTAVAALERRLLPVITRMEQRGVRVDTERAADAIKTIDLQAVTAQRNLDEAAGFPVNPNPSDSIKQLFDPVYMVAGKRTYSWREAGQMDKVKNLVNGRWTTKDGSLLESTEAGMPSLDAKALRNIKHPAAGLILRLRKLVKTRDTFLKGHILGHHHLGVIHANYNQTKSEADGGDSMMGTGTGRLSVNDPALQQIHKRDADIASIVRSLFLPDEGHEWVCDDWSQMDFRVFAHYIKVPKMLDAYRKDPLLDFHALVAGFTGLPRKPRFAGDANAKQINLGLIFGMGEGKMAYEMGLPYELKRDERRPGREFFEPGPEARAVFERYHEEIPGVKTFLKTASSVAKTRGYVKTILGSHIRFPGGQFTHKAGGLVFQGSAADALKVKICEVDSYLETMYNKYGCRLLLNVHDEFDGSIPPGLVEIRQEVTRIIEDFHSEHAVIRFRVPIRSSKGVGSNWWIASKE